MRPIRISDGAWVLAFALVVRGVVLADALDAPFWNVPLIDESAYLRLAAMLGRGGAPPHGAWYVAPGYAYILHAFALAGVGPLTVKLAQLLAGAASAVCVWHLARSLCGRVASLAAGVAFAIVPTVLLQELLLLKTTFATTAALAAVALAMPPRGPGPLAFRTALRRWIVAGAALATATLLRGELLILALVLCAAAVVARRRRWPGAPPLAAPGVAAAFVAAAIAVPTLQNARWSGGDLVPFAFGGGVNFYIGNHAGGDGSYVPLRPDRSDPQLEEADAVLLASQALGRAARPSEVSRYWFHRGFEWWRREPLAAAVLTARKWALVWGPRELADTLSTAQAGRWIAALRPPIPAPAIVLPLAAIALWATRRRRDLWALHAFVIGAQLAVVPFFVFERFRMHLVAACVPFAAFAVERGVQLLRARRWRPVVACAVAAGAFGGITAVVRVPRDEIVLRVNVGELLYQAGRHEEALREFEAVRAASPGEWRVDINIANVQAALGRDAAALAALDRVLRGLYAEAERTGQPSAEELTANHDRAGDLELRRGNREAAAHHYQAALRFATPAQGDTLRAKLARIAP
jgi:tetratricopeptide (TPR) repeat protein